MILRIVKDGKQVGEVDIVNGKPIFRGWATKVFRLPCQRLGRMETARILLNEGWSNGYLYLARA